MKRNRVNSGKKAGGRISFRELVSMKPAPRHKKRMNARSLRNIGMHLRDNCNMSEERIDKWMNERFILDNSVKG